MFPPTVGEALPGDDLKNKFINTRFFGFEGLWPINYRHFFAGVFGPLANTNFRKSGSPPGGGIDFRRFWKSQNFQNLEMIFVD